MVGPLLLYAICPLSMLVIMRMMMASGSAPQNAIPGRSNSLPAVGAVTPRAALTIAIALALAGGLAVLISVAIVRPAALLALKPYALFFLCPLSMLLMMRMMGSERERESGRWEATSMDPPCPPARLTPCR
jgi:hypothetical protein